MNYEQHENAENGDGNANTHSIILDRLAVCFHDPNPEHVKAAWGLLISDHVLKHTPGLSVTRNQRYKASARLRVPFNASDQQTICFEAGPQYPGQASYRLEFNPANVTKAGLDDMMVFLSSAIDPDPVEFFRDGRITRCDVALDLPGRHVEDTIVRTSRLQKHGVYSNRQGLVETVYLGTPKSRCVVAYEKAIKGSPFTYLRLECRLKPRCRGYEVAALKNPFEKVELIPGTFAEATGIAIPAQFIADSISIGGLKRALLPLTPKERKAVKKAYKDAGSLLPNLDAAWSAWPDTLIKLGLGKELGALPMHKFGDSTPLASIWYPDHEMCN